jgi:transcriptional regulator with XRE-family HTH domain
MYTLSQWMGLNEIKSKDFANELGVTPGYLSRLRNGKQKPGRALLMQIHTITKGDVGLEDWSK